MQSRMDMGESAARFVSEVTIKKQKSMEALDKLRVYASDSRRTSTMSTMSTTSSLGLPRKAYPTTLLGGGVSKASPSTPTG